MWPCRSGGGGSTRLACSAAVSATQLGGTVPAGHSDHGAAEPVDADDVLAGDALSDRLVFDHLDPFAVATGAEPFEHLERGSHPISPIR